MTGLNLLGLDSLFEDRLQLTHWGYDFCSNEDQLRVCGTVCYVTPSDFLEILMVVIKRMLRHHTKYNCIQTAVACVSEILLTSSMQFSSLGFAAKPWCPQYMFIELFRKYYPDVHSKFARHFGAEIYSHHFSERCDQTPGYISDVSQRQISFTSETHISTEQIRVTFAIRTEPRIKAAIHAPRPAYISIEEKTDESE
jgi:hypothetical protein